MCKKPAIVSALLMALMSGWLHGRDLSGQTAGAPQEINAGKKTGSPFPFPELRSKSSIVLVRHGCYGTCARYSITLYGNGKVMYEGEEFVRVKGRARARISTQTLDDLLKKINEMDFFAFAPQHGDKCITDGPTASITLSEPGRQRTLDDECVLGNDIEALEKTIDDAVHIQQWVFIDAKELQSQIDRGWDLATHGEPYADEAVRWDDPEVLRVLITNGLPVDSRNREGETLLLRAVLSNKPASAKALLEMGAAPKALDDHGWAPAQHAGSRGVEMCKLFLKHGAAINDQDGMGDTMLISAASVGDLEAVKFLLDSGANPNLRRKNGDTALGWAKKTREQYRSLANSTSTPQYAQIFGDPEIGRARYMADVRRFEAVIDYLRQHGGTE
jgi:uncharacterized protein